jgi:hypothetical protein
MAVDRALPIAQGAFTVDCPAAAKDNSDYPYFAVWIDANRDGKCNAGDFGVDGSRYGWSSFGTERYAVDERFAGVGASIFATIGPLTDREGLDSVCRAFQ